MQSFAEEEFENLKKLLEGIFGEELLVTWKQMKMQHQKWLFSLFWRMIVHNLLYEYFIHKLGYQNLVNMFTDDTS